jgi:hypothetical protein
VNQPPQIFSLSMARTWRGRSGAGTTTYGGEGVVADRGIVWWCLVWCEEGLVVFGLKGDVYGGEGCGGRG